MRTTRWKAFLRAGHLPTLLTALLYFDFCFAIWVLNAAMAPFISEELHLSAAEKGLMLSVPVIAGALMRFPLGLLSQYIGRKRAAMVEMSIIVVGLLVGWLVTDSFQGVVGMGVLLGVAGASFGVALSLGSGWYPPEYKGLAMGIAGAGNSGAVLAVLLAPPLAAAVGWRAVYGLAVIPMVIAMVLLQVFAKEPPDRVHAPMRDHLKVLVDKDAWVFNLLYMVSFGGYIGLTSFLPTFFHDQYGIPKQEIGTYAAVAIVAASVLRVAGGWLSDKLGGVRLLFSLLAIVILSVGAAATLPGSPWAMVGLLVVAFAAMGAANGAVFQLVPLRFAGATAVAGSLIGEIGALAGGFLPNAMGTGRAWTGSFAPGFIFLAVLAVAAVGVLALVQRRWTATWVGEGGRARVLAPAEAPVAVAADVREAA
jgi:NNP family nitrate/nitrite transporter-like MFS transporter